MVMATTSKKQVKMQRLDRDGLITVGEHLTGEGREKFCLAANGRLFLVAIAAGLAELKRGRVPVVEAPSPMKAEVTVHTALGKSIWHGLTVLVVDPDVDPAVQAAAARVREAFGPKAPSPNALPAERVKAASRVREHMTERAVDLAMLPPLPVGGAVGPRIERWCTMGEGLKADLIGERLAREAPVQEAPRSKQATNATRFNALLHRARAALREEVGLDPNLPRTLETECFGLYDSLVEAKRMRAEQEARREEKKNAAESAEKPAPSAPPASPSAQTPA
jgi:hypothetical protein